MVLYISHFTSYSRRGFTDENNLGESCTCSPVKDTKHGHVRFQWEMIVKHGSWRVVLLCFLLTIHVFSIKIPESEQCVCICNWLSPLSGCNKHRLTVIALQLLSTVCANYLMFRTFYIIVDVRYYSLPGIVLHFIDSSMALRSFNTPNLCPHSSSLFRLTAVSKDQLYTPKV